MIILKINLPLRMQKILPEDDIDVNNFIINAIDAYSNQRATFIDIKRQNNLLEKRLDDLQLQLDEVRLKFDDNANFDSELMQRNKQRKTNSETKTLLTEVKNKIEKDKETNVDLQF